MFLMKKRFFSKICLGLVIAIVIAPFLFAPINSGQILGLKIGIPNILIAHVYAQQAVCDPNTGIGCSYQEQTGDTTPSAPGQTSIDSYLNAPSTIIGAVVDGVLLLLRAVIGLLIPIAISFFGVLVEINLDLLQPSSNVAVSVGWDLFRQITNLGFVLGIIVIAIATIVRSRSYRMQQILWKLIVAALLVNFSLVIAGVFLKVSDSFTVYFLGQFSGNNTTYTSTSNTVAGVGQGNVDINSGNNQLIQSMTAQMTDFSGSANIVSPDSKSGENANFLTKAFTLVGSLVVGPSIGAVLSLAFETIALLIILLTFIVLAGQIFIRYFYLTALLIVSPIVWLMWVFPFGSRWWREWWNHFIKWTFMLPLNLFFLWFSVKMMRGVTLATGKLTDSLYGVGKSGGNIFVGYTSLSAIMGSMMAVAFIILGMKLSHKIGISGADAGVKWASSAGTAIKNQGIEMGKRGASRAYVSSGAASGIQKGLTAIGSTTVGRAIGLGRVAQIGEKRKAEVEKVAMSRVDRLKKEFGDRTKDERKAMLQTTRHGSSTETAMLEVMAEKGELANAGERLNSPEKIANFLRLQKTYGRKTDKLETNFAGNEAMYRALANPDGMSPNDKGELKSYEEHAREFFGKRRDDHVWKEMAKSFGSAILDVDDKTGKYKKVGWLGESTDKAREAYIRAIRDDQGRMYHGSIPGLGDKQIKRLNQEMTLSAAQLIDPEETIEVSAPESAGPRSKLLDASGNPIKQEMKVQTQLLKQLVDQSIKSGDLQKAQKYLAMSQNDDVKKVMNKVNKGLGKIIGGGYTTEEEKGEASEAKPEPKTETKGK
jgi:uncharacterized membrane protein YoaK (UPF0700 family)